MEARFEMNGRVAETLRQFADLLEEQQANPFRVIAYRRGADTIDALDKDVREIIARQGMEGLINLPHVGSGVASAVEEIIRTGRLTRLERLRGEHDPVQLFQTVPGIGEVLARQIHDALQVDTLEELEEAARDGRLEAVAGVGPRRAQAIRASLAVRLGRPRRSRRALGAGPGVADLLDVDREYREKAEAGRLRTIAPRRFNPEGAAWLPVLHTDRGPWHFTALYSNTARAHQLGRTKDWVVIYFYDSGEGGEGQHTVVTETVGPLRGRRVVRGREAECREIYAASLVESGPRDLGAAGSASAG